MIVSSSSTVLANLAYLIGAVVLAAIGGVAVWLHHRQPKSVDANMASFRRGLNALAPDPGSTQPAGSANPASLGRVWPQPGGLSHVRLGRDEEEGDGSYSPAEPAGDRYVVEDTPVEETAGERTGQQTG